MAFNNNSSGFNGLPGGSRNYDGSFTTIGENGDWWSSTESETDYAWFRSLSVYNGPVYRLDYDKEGGFSVVCLRD